ncbi:recombinase family protein [Rhizobium sp. JAB6]|nr:recombinase family protein [Rhizobium sp. JAB6]
MKRAALYGRYSTDLQNDRSVEDQFRLCHEYSARLDAAVVKQFSDRAKSGASMFGRQGLADLMTAAERGEFDILVTEHADRVSRDISDLGHIHKVLKFRGIEMHCVNGGLMDTVQIGMYGLVGQMQREEGARKVKRGMIGVVRSGRNAGGKAYGYRPVVGKPGELEIVEDEASTVRRIFEMYAAGISPRTIAGILNREAVPAPRGRQWNASTINGSNQRNNGILRNSIYAGKIMWNRTHMVKDPTSGKRLSRANDHEQIETIDAPHLRIIDEDIFEAVQGRKVAAAKVGPKAPRSKRLLSGLLRCGACGGGMVMIGPDRNGHRIQCSDHRESGVCHNTRRYYLGRIEALVMNRLRSIFSDTKYIESYIQAYQEEQKKLRSSALRDRASATRLLEEAKAEITKIISMMAKELIGEEEGVALLTPLREQRDAQKAILESIEEPTNVIELQPKAVTRFRENIESLAQIVAKEGAEPSPELIGPFREIVAAVVVHQTDPGQPYDIGLKGRLASLVSPELSVIKVVAEEGFEPPTQGL